MLERKMSNQIEIKINELQPTILTNIERRLIKQYRGLSYVEQEQIRRVTEILSNNPKEPDGY